MKPALAFRQPHYPSSWQALPNGDVIAEEVNQALVAWWPKFFGYHLLKIGALSGFIDSQTCSIKHQVTLVEQNTLGDVVADIDDLPFLEHSVDVCLLSHALEFSVDPHHVIREANRVLIPNGYLVISGFNPFSLAGLNKLLPYRRQTSPWNERFFSPMRVKDWLHLMGYEILLDQRAIHSSLVGVIGQGNIANKWQALAKKVFPSLGSIYVIVAKKRRHPLTPIKPKWKLSPKFEAVNVANMNTSNKRHKRFIKN
jgi:SAM-dependent methyltransferase